jgi:hypothetical protein
MNDYVKTLFAHVKEGDRLFQIVDVIKCVGDAENLHAAQNRQQWFSNAAEVIECRKKSLYKEAESTPDLCGFLCESRVDSAILFLHDPLDPEISRSDFIGL